MGPISDLTSGGALDL